MLFSNSQHLTIVHKNHHGTTRVKQCTFTIIIHCSNVVTPIALILRVKMSYLNLLLAIELFFFVAPS